MKKILLIAAIGIFGVNVASAQYGTTKAERISNGCGSELSPGSRAGAALANKVDNFFGGPTYQQRSCDQHDKDYYNGVDKKKADRDFTYRSPVKGVAVQAAQSLSQKSYDQAQQDRATSQKLQPTWEKENQQCLDASEYKVTYR